MIRAAALLLVILVLRCSPQSDGEKGEKEKNSDKDKTELGEQSQQQGGRGQKRKHSSGGREELFICGGPYDTRYGVVQVTGPHYLIVTIQGVDGPVLLSPAHVKIIPGMRRYRYIESGQGTAADDEDADMSPKTEHGDKAINPDGTDSKSSGGSSPNLQAAAALSDSAWAAAASYGLVRPGFEASDPAASYGIFRPWFEAPQPGEDPDSSHFLFRPYETPSSSSSGLVQDGGAQGEVVQSRDEKQPGRDQERSCSSSPLYSGYVDIIDREECSREYIVGTLDSLNQQYFITPPCPHENQIEFPSNLRAFVPPGRRDERYYFSRTRCAYVRCVIRTNDEGEQYARILTREDPDDDVIADSESSVELDENGWPANPDIYDSYYQASDSTEDEEDEEDQVLGPRRVEECQKLFEEEIRRENNEQAPAACSEWTIGRRDSEK